MEKNWLMEVFTFRRLQSHSKKTDLSSIGMLHSDKVISISQNIVKKACVSWKSHAKQLVQERVCVVRKFLNSEARTLN